MKDDEIYAQDYALIVTLQLLVEMQEAKEEEVFAVMLQGIWDTLLDKIPKEVRRTVPFVVLDTYFTLHGELRTAVRAGEEAMVAAIGYEAHQEKLARTRQKIDKTTQKLKDILAKQGTSTC